MGVNEDIAKAVLRRLVGHELRYEFDVPGAPVRADAVDISLEALVGWEIKTAQDTTKRLTGQVAGYDRFFDHCWLFTAPQHANVELPEWWGLAVFEAKPFAAFDWPPGWSHEQHEEWQHRQAKVVAQATVTVIREAQPNPNQKAVAMWSALWAGERKALCTVLGVHRSHHWRFADVADKLNFDQWRLLARWAFVNRDPTEYPFSVAAEQKWAYRVAELLGLPAPPPRPSAHRRAPVVALADRHPSLFPVVDD